MKFIYSNYTLYRPWQLLFSFLDLSHLLRNQVPFSDTVLKKSVQCKNHPKYTDFHGRHLLLGFWHIFSSNPLAFGQHWNHLQPGSTTSTPPIWSCPWSESFSEFSLTFFSNSNFVNRTPMTSISVVVFFSALGVGGLSSLGLLDRTEQAGTSMIQVKFAKIKGRQWSRWNLNNANNYTIQQ